MIWSVSGHHEWKRCQRQFAFDHLVASATAKDKVRREAHILGQIQQVPQWVGSLLHTAIKQWVIPEIAAGRWPKESHVLSPTQALIRRQYLFSQSQSYLDARKSEAGVDYCVLAPHVGGHTSDTDFLENTIAAVTTALVRVLRCRDLARFLLGRRGYKPEMRLFFDVDGVHIRAQPDLLMLSTDGQGLDIVDWKATSSHSDYRFQVAVYALAASRNRQVIGMPVDHATGYVINVLSGCPERALDMPYHIGQDELNETVDAIYESIESMRAVVGDRAYEQLDIERFEYAQSVGSCALCKWQTLCVELSRESPAKSLPGSRSRQTQLELPLGTDWGPADREDTV